MIGLIQLSLQDDGNLIKCGDDDYFINQYIDSSDPEQQQNCTESCNNNVWYQQIIDNETQNYAQICMSQITTCKELSTKDATYKRIQDNQNQCVTQCSQSLWYDNNEDYLCFSYIRCSFSQPEFQSYTIRTQDDQCVDSCSNSVNCKIPSDDGKTCYQQCQDGQYLIYANQTCSQTCDTTFYYQFQYEQYNICYNDSCEGLIYNNITYYLLDETRKCSSDCKQAIPYIYQQELKCVTSCSGNYAAPKDKSDNICDDTCTFVRTSSQGKQCTEDKVSCPDTFPKKLQQQSDPIRYQCVQSCSQTSKSLYSQNNFCVYSCGQNNETQKSIVWRETDDDQVCDDQNSTSCTYNDQIIEYQDLQTSQCLQSCSDESNTTYYKYYHIDEIQAPICSNTTECRSVSQSQQYKVHSQSNPLLCVLQCPKSVWIEDVDFKCINSCPSDDEFNSIDLNSNKCNQITLIQCSQQLHIEIEYHNTKCQFIPAASDCNSYSQYDNSIYLSSDDPQVCVNCIQSNYEVRDNDGVKRCEKIKEMKLSPGAIIGIVFSIICAILICIGLCWFAIRYFHVNLCCFKCFGGDRDQRGQRGDRESGSERNDRKRRDEWGTDGGKEMNELKSGGERQVGDDIKQFYL